MKMVGEKKPRIKSLILDVLTLKEQVKQIEPLKQKVLELMKVIEHLKMQRKVGGENSTKENQQLVFKCNTCEFFFETNKKLKKHYDQMHPTRIECKKCDEEFMKNSDLEMHRNIKW